MQRKSTAKRLISYLPIAFCLPLTVFFPKIFGIRGYYRAAFVFAAMCLLSVFLSFENSAPSRGKITLMACLCALGVGGRIAFAAIPFVKPVAAVVIITAVALGPQCGFLRGAITMLASNFMFGQGPWTIWQMFAFGVLGLVSGWIFYKRPALQKPAVLACAGFVMYVFVTGPILDLSGLFAYTYPGKSGLAATILAGLPVNITAGAATFIFLLLISSPILKRLNRIITKYGIN